jgi:hypothetical protein
LAAVSGWRRAGFSRDRAKRRRPARWEDVLTPQMRSVHRKWRAPSGASVA